MKRHQKLNSQLPQIIYTPESQLRYPLDLARQMWRDLLASRELAWRLMMRDINAQYRQSFLGIAWAFLPPIVLAVSLTLAKDAKVINVGVTDLPYPAYVMFSTALWQTFVEALNGPVQAVTVAKPMLARVNFPREALILAKVGEVFFNFAIKLILIVVLFIWFRIPINWTVILTPIPLIHLVLLGTFIGIFLAPLGVLYQDISKGLTLITGFWLFLTPVIYPVPKEGIFGLLVKLNPVTPLLVTVRDLATTGVVSESFSFWLVSTITLVGLVLTWIVFRLAMPFVVERVSS
ncbi:ABC transporter permease [Anabaena cylindrica FACHB-243]|uniref:ABC-2 type transporter n=1 Tax=Anabaena cylindrica (strain ATCC 27899 / PCC 7122) TaxID=272123 RepID=K9ZHE0_ANACC|nr:MULTISPECIES: ABC transporter permease [Anabaena]AFZ58606.1 ABC-2 type transporter [Anabaena cylindrica PCC 7122]MBD2419952.1 ABC transporter permease [Anabaena cylindrica FACHB-243]MBY5280641.1 ABC transporter permease [Anabaena sp. CCAP 1446/1C]MBY5311256.1 ABC transporter permease [Anabaena sp. CCAP 1446/1C]MCM2407155.1 ABC transporter permease [Anabaena sp. CCAP 1446/1C]